MCLPRQLRTHDNLYVRSSADYEVEDRTNNTRTSRAVGTRGVLFCATAIAPHGWHRLLLSFEDNDACLDGAMAIRHWDFRGAGVQHFMGYPYTIAAVSTVLRLSFASSLWLAAVASLVSTLLVAGLSAAGSGLLRVFQNVTWLQTSFLGGSEPLAVAFGMGAFTSFRRGHTLARKRNLLSWTEVSSHCDDEPRDCKFRLCRFSVHTK
jgi:hypothetical protein